MSLPRDDAWTDPGSMDPPRRIGRKILAGLGFVVLAVVGSAAVWYGTSLRDLPDIGPPFDLEAAGTVAIPEDENAFTYYEAAVAKLVGRRVGMAGGGRYVSWVQSPQADRDWFLANRDAMRLWFAGTTKDRAVYHQPKDVRHDTNLDFAQQLRTFIPLAQLAALRMEGQGDFAEAWAWHRAALRSSRHCGMYGTFIERLLGFAMYTKVAPSIMSWSDHPNVDIDTLRGALAEVEAIHAMTPPFSQVLKTEYFALANLLDAPGLTIGRVVRAMEEKAEHQPNASERLKWSVRKFLRREPHRSRRALRLVFANWLAVADLPEPERARRRRNFPLVPLFDPPDDAPEVARRVDPTTLSRGVESTDLLKAVLPALRTIEPILRSEATARTALVEHLADQIAVRETPRTPGVIPAPAH